MQSRDRRNKNHAILKSLVFSAPDISLNIPKSVVFSDLVWRLKLTVVFTSNIFIVFQGEHARDEFHVNNMARDGNSVRL